MNHSSFGVCTHLLEFFVKRLVLNRGFVGVRFSVWYSLGRVGRYRVWVVLQLFLDLRFQHRTEGVFIGTSKQFFAPNSQPAIGPFDGERWSNQA
jgi:hypothetical protein